MPRPSPQTDRVVAVIELLAGTDAGATMTEIARSIGVDQSTCVHLLAALTIAGFVVRQPADRRYHLGPALVRPGQIAAERHPVLGPARAEMAALAATIGAPCFAFAPETDRARLVQLVWPPGQLPPPVRIGDTVPLTPPLGMVFLAWAADAAFEAWLALDRTMASEHADRLRQQRTAVRRHGFVAELAPPDAEMEGLASVLDDRDSPYRDGLIVRLLAAHGGDDHIVTDLDDAARTRAVTSIGAPVFGTDGSVVLSLSLAAFSGPLAATDIRAIGAQVRATARRTTQAIGGRQVRRP